MPEPLRALVVDDEPLAREELCYLLRQMGDTIAIVGEAGSGPDALDAVAEHEPDLVFLDVQMPGLTGFEVARRLVADGAAVSVVFVTAFDQHAIEAFEVNAVDSPVRHSHAVIDDVDDRVAVVPRAADEDASFADLG